MTYSNQEFYHSYTRAIILHYQHCLKLLLIGTVLNFSSPYQSGAGKNRIQLKNG